MTRVNHGRFRRQKIHEPDVPEEFRQERPPGPTKAELRAWAEKATAEYRKPVSKLPTASAVSGRLKRTDS